MAAETFDPGWLELRESVDHRSRSSDLVSRLRTRWTVEGWSRILDLGAGTGSNLRYLAPRLPGRQEWRLVDRDAALLDRVRPVEGADRIERVAADLQDEGIHLAARADLVTASALIDLVSARWLRRLVIACESARAGVLLTLTYDGSIGWGPPDAESRGNHSRPRLRDDEDDRVRRAVNLHQRKDKGLGPALGPAATDLAESLLQVAGYETWRASSAWRLGPDDRDIALALIDGWEQAAIEMRPDDADLVHAWGERRRQSVRRDEVRPVVGHLDLLALPR